MTTHPHQQLSLFDSPALRIAALGRATKCALRKAVDASGLSRPEVVHRANELAAESGVSMCAGNGALSEATFNKWLDLNSPGHMPGLVPITILCIILNCPNVFTPALEAQSLEIMGLEDRKYRDLGKLEAELKCLRKKKRQIEESA